MQSLTFSVLLLVASSCAIFNARNAKEFEFPYLVKITGNSYCSGALISDKFVLTAAHCLMNHSGKYELIFGDNTSWHGRSQRSNPHRVVLQGKMKKFIHEKFTMPTAVFDIGIIELPRTVKFSRAIKPIKITRNQEFDVLNVRISGWGKSNGYFYPSSLKTAEMHLISIERCKKFESNYVETITDDHICTVGNSNGKVISPCDGDSGKLGIELCQVLTLNVIRFTTRFNCNW
jgi:secreted trypsin-like serine protease